MLTLRQKRQPPHKFQSYKANEWKPMKLTVLKTAHSFSPYCNNLGETVSNPPEGAPLSFVLMAPLFSFPSHNWGSVIVSLPRLNCQTLPLKNKNTAPNKMSCTPKVSSQPVPGRPRSRLGLGSCSAPARGSGGPLVTRSVLALLLGSQVARPCEPS